MNFKHLAFFCWLLIPCLVEAQELRSCQTTSSGVTSNTVSGLTVLHCIGQGSVIGTYSNSKTTLRQGFLQPAMAGYKAGTATNPIEVSVFPNPFDGMVRVEFDDDENRTVVFRLYSISGKVLFNQNRTFSKTLNLTFPELAAGFYILSIETGGQIESIKLQKL